MSKQSDQDGECLETWRQDLHRRQVSNCTNNVIRLDSKIHLKISSWYNSKQEESKNMLVRDWQAQYDWSTQQTYAIKILYNFGGELPLSWNR